jgi:site-specific recombinase XerD
MLYDIKQRVIQRKNDFEYKSQVYTAKMLIEDCVVDLDGRSNVYKDIMYRLINERRLSMNSRKRYEYSYRKICEYLGRDEFIVDELNLGFVKDFSSWLCKSVSVNGSSLHTNKVGVSDGTIKDLLSCVAAVWNYAIDRRIVSDELFPFREFKFTTRFKRGERDYFLDVSHIKLLMDYWLDLVIERDGNRWHYKDGAYDLLRKRTSKEWGILWFLLCYKLNGSAPVDVALLKLSECKNIEINGERYWAIDFKRQKTKRDVHVRWKRDMFSIIALEHFMGDSRNTSSLHSNSSGMSRNGYVYRVVDMDDEYKKLKQSSRNAEVALKWVRKAFEEINGKIIQSNVDKGVREHLIEVQRVDMYTARHSFANHFINSPNATIGGLASLMARSPNTIATYVHQLTKDEEIASLVESMVI